MKLQVTDAENKYVIDAPQGARLLDYLKENNIYINAACGGKGTCHKCRVQVKEGFLAPTPTDRLAFSDSEIANGWRLSCQAKPRLNCSIHIPLTESLRSKARVVEFQPLPEHFELVCDLGSTGVVVAIVKKDSPQDNPQNNICAEAHILNQQIKFGADVMTRLEYAQKGQTEDLQKALFISLNNALTALHAKYPQLNFANRTMHCSGNSAMVSLLLSWSTETLAVAPFQPAKLSSDDVQTENHLHLLNLKLRTLPLMGGFVGADTFAGLFYILKYLKPQNPWLFIDIGTNTEIILSDESGKLWFGSAPAGPAFEGGNISKGMRAEPGAIAIAQYLKESGWKLETIGHDQPRGICGSGLIDVISEGVEHGLISEDGYLPEGKLIIYGDIELSADDVREFQLAKSATRTACEILIDRAGCKPQTIFLAGTFAQHLNLQSVERVGLIPNAPKISQIGNSSLYGTILYSLAPDTEKKAFTEDVRSRSEQIELALQDDFQGLFVQNLNF